MTDYERLRGLVAAARLPWRIVPYGDGDSLVIHDARQGDWRVCFMATPGCRGEIEKIEANAALIVEAVNALPGLLDRLAKLEAKLVDTNAERIEVELSLSEAADRIAKLEEARDHYAGLYAERCGMLLQAQAERDAAEKRLSEAEKVIETFERLEKSIMSDIKSAHSRGPGASEWMREDDREMRAEIRAAFKAARALLTQETDNGK